MNINVQFEIINNDGGFVEFHETVESALIRVADTFGFSIKDLKAIYTKN